MATVNRPHYGTPGNSVQGERRAQIVAWIDEGLPRNEVARRAGLSGSTISGIAKAEGRTFDRSMIRSATEARTADLRARRAEIAAVLLEDAMRLRGQIWQPHEYIDHGGKDFNEARWTQDEPSPADKLKLMQAAASALGRHLNLEQHDADAGDKPAVDAWLDAMTGGPPSTPGR